MAKNLKFYFRLSTTLGCVDNFLTLWIKYHPSRIKTIIIHCPTNKPKRTLMLKDITIKLTMVLGEVCK